MKHDDAHIIDNILKGDTRSYEEIIGRYDKKVFALIAGIVPNRQDAEELVQDVFLKAFRNLGRFNGESSFATWLYRIAYNMAISATRKTRHDHTSIDSIQMSDVDEADIDDALDDYERIEQLHDAIERLSPEERTLLTLVYTDGKTLAETALIMGITEGNAKVRLHRTRKRLYLLMTK